MEKTKTPDYNKRASLKYQQSKERLNILLDSGTKDRIKAKYGNISINGYIKDLINKDLSSNNIDINIKNNPFEN